MPAVDIEALFATVPQFLPWALRSFSEAMFKNGGALSNYRHLVWLLNVGYLVPGYI